MKIKITGSKGYLGKIIVEKLIQENFDVSGIDRHLLYGPVNDLKKEISGTDVIINLAGAPILQRWNKKNKAIIYNSRINTTQNLISAIKLLPPKEQPKKFISASAIGIYKSGEVHNEESKNYDNGFVGHVVQGWEASLNELPETIQIIIFRIGLVLGKEAKIIKNLVPLFKIGFGGYIGSGKQSFPFIHEKDLASAFLWVIKNYNKSNIFNLTAPQNITNREFTFALAKTLKRPAIFPVPEFIIQIIFGEAAILVTKSPKIIPDNILKEDFTYTYPTIKCALKEIVG